MVVEKPNTAILGVMFVAAALLMFAIMSIQYWPSWMIEKVWVGAKYLAIPLLGFFYARLLMWYILFHFGITFWILPNFTFLSSMFSPLVKFEMNTNFMDISFFLPRLVSLGVLSTGLFKLNEYVLGRIAYRKKNETIQAYVSLFVKKYSKNKYKKE